jgi:hypothetical protein
MVHHAGSMARQTSGSTKSVTGNDLTWFPVE